MLFSKKIVDTPLLLLIHENSTDACNLHLQVRRMYRINQKWYLQENIKNALLFSTIFVPEGVHIADCDGRKENFV